MNLSTQNIASKFLGVQYPFNFRKELFENLDFGYPDLSLRSQLKHIEKEYGSYVLPPKRISKHPRLSPIPAIHFDHYNSSVMNGDAPGLGDELDVKLKRQGAVLGTCLNFLVDKKENIYAFCGNLAGGVLHEDPGIINVKFKLALFNKSLDKLDEFNILEFSKKRLEGGDLPINLGYFVMDNMGRVILVKNKTDIVFVGANRDKKLRAFRTWPMLAHFPKAYEKNLLEVGLAQVLPDYHQGYWVMTLGNAKKNIWALLAYISDQGELLDYYEFKNEVIENGMAVDSTGVYLITDHKLYKFYHDKRGKIQKAWTPQRYERSSPGKVKKGVISKYGSGSTPTLFGKKDDLIAFTDNADERINLVVVDRNSGKRLFKIPLFYKNGSANENTVIAYDDSIVVQNWYGAKDYDEDMEGLMPGLVRYDIKRDRSGYTQVWWNDEFATTATARLCTQTGLIYGTEQKDAILEKYEMSFIDFRTGKKVRGKQLGIGKGYRIAMSPAYLLPDGKLIQPVRRGFVVIKTKT